MKNVKNYTYKELIFDGKYEEFSDFYDLNKEIIYRSIIELFEEFKKTRKSVLSIYVSSKIHGLDWDTELNFTKDNSIVLRRDLLPYFEQIEDYETCEKILNLYKDLTFKK